MNIYIKHYDELTKDELFNIYKLRVNVFVVEQKCPYEEIDDYDKDAYHLFLEDKGEIIGYLRILKSNSKFKEASIGRVISTKRRSGNGTLILKKAIHYLKNDLGEKKLLIEAQTYAVKLYEGVGFKKYKEEFLEDGIPHIKMIMDLGV